MITQVWTRDSTGADRVSFACGEQVRLSLATENPNAAAVSQDTSALVEGPNGRVYYEESRITFAPGPGRFEWVIYLPTDAAGSFTFTADLFPEGGLGSSDASSRFTAACGS